MSGRFVIKKISFSYIFAANEDKRQNARSCYNTVPYSRFFHAEVWP